MRSRSIFRFFSRYLRAQRLKQWERRNGHIMTMATQHQDRLRARGREPSARIQNVIDKLSAERDRIAPQNTGELSCSAS